MASVTCVCGRAFGAGEWLCARCGRPKPKVQAPRHQADPSGNTLSEPASVPAPPEPERDGPPSAQACDHQAARPGATNGPACGAVLDSGAWTIVLPWGTLRLEPGEKIAIGRELDPYAAELDAFDKVSRRHAEIRCTPRGQLLLVDEHSTNGTFRNGKKIDPARPVELAAGDEISFSKSLRVVIQEG